MSIPITFEDALAAEQRIRPFLAPTPLRTNEAMRGYGARLIGEGRDYDEAAGVADRLVHERGLRLVHSTNDRDVIAGAATISLEIFNEAPALDALVVAALREGLAGFVTATEDELADAVRLVVRTTHTLVEGAGAAGVAGLVTLADQLAGARVGVILSGANIDQTTVRRVFCR